MNQRALEAYRAGRAFRKALDLARTVFAAQVVPLEEEWGDYLVAQKQMDAAINHYIEAGCSLKAIEAAMASRQWAKAAQIVEMQDASVARPYLRMIADHYAEVRDYALAQRYYVAGKNARAAVDMYIKVGVVHAHFTLCCIRLCELTAGGAVGRRAQAGAAAPAARGGVGAAGAAGRSAGGPTTVRRCREDVPGGARTRPGHQHVQEPAAV